MTKAREIAELGQKLTVDASGNLDIAGTASFDNRISLEASTGFANLEMGGPDGGYIDLKSPFSDDYDGRLIWDGADMIVTTGATGNVILKKNNATRLQTSTDGIEVTNRVGIGTSPVYPLHIFDNNTDRDMDANAGGQLFIDGNGYGFGIALNLEGANIYTNSASRDLIFGTDETERVRIDGAGNILHQGGSPEYHFGTSSASHYNWRIAAQEAVSAGFEIASGTQSAGSGALTDTYTTRFVIKADTGNVGIGTINPEYVLDIDDASGNAYVSINRATKAQGEVGYKLGGGTSGSDWYIYQKTNSDTLNFYNNGDKLTINNSGNVGIGTSPSYRLHVTGGNIGSTSGDTVQHAAFSGARQHLDFREVRTADGTDWNYLTYKIGMRVDTTRHQSIDFVTDGAYNEHIDIRTGNEVFHSRFTSNGKLGVGLSSPTSTLDVEGTITGGDGQVVSGNRIMRGRYGTGSIATWGGMASDGGPMMGYGVWPRDNTSEAFVSASNLSGLRRGAFHVDGDIHRFYGSGTQTVAENSNISLNVYASIDGDGIKFNGDTAAANGLDDYEEGTYTVSIGTSISGSITLNSTWKYGSYVKVGNIVHVQGAVDQASASSPNGYFTISLPFTAKSDSPVQAYRGSASVTVYNATSNSRDFVPLLVQGESYLRVYLGDASGLQGDSANALNNGSSPRIAFQVTYRTT